jgi:hypothetical protein
VGRWPRRLEPLQDLAHGEAERLNLDQDDVRPQPADHLGQLGVIGGAASGHPEVGHGGQPGGKRFGNHPVVVHQEQSPHIHRSTVQPERRSVLIQLNEESSS